MAADDTHRVDIVKATDDGKQSRYIVTLKDGTNMHTHLAWLYEYLSGNSSITHNYSGLFNAYAGTFDEAALEHIHSSPDVERTSKDSILTFGGQQ